MSKTRGAELGDYLDNLQACPICEKTAKEVERKTLKFDLYDHIVMCHFLTPRMSMQCICREPLEVMGHTEKDSLRYHLAEAGDTLVDHYVKHAIANL